MSEREPESQPHGFWALMFDVYLFMESKGWCKCRLIQVSHAKDRNCMPDMSNTTVDKVKTPCAIYDDMT